MSTNIETFIVARLDEDEASALTAGGPSARAHREVEVKRRMLAEHPQVQPEAWFAGGSCKHYNVNVRMILGEFAGDVRDRDRADFEADDHGRVLAEIVRAANADGTLDACSLCDFGDTWGVEWTQHPCTTLLALASVWSDHPDYQIEWAGQEGQEAASGSASRSR